jgi:trigger factor
LNLTIEDITETRKKLHVSFTSEEVEKEQGKILKDFSGHARISGFRPGKAPQSLIQQRYRKELAEELDRKITSLAYDTAVK